MQSTTTPTAATAYAYHQGLALQRLARVKVALDDHNAKAAQAPRNWGYAGDVEDVGRKLLELLGALGALTPAEHAAHGI
ncbi:MAG TPA: hypothetical protein VE934_11905 [Polaromonas sp.]|uniref:hypothetical protein n=1 Tax=Polaromonas sp. TaxID=1869339 RepID=UPI002D52F94D|nr:hypothetical protein [Polaromonas sp.]HYW57659.1 hypothetical protein [Polaromonas sp.]